MLSGFPCRTRKGKFGIINFVRYEASSSFAFPRNKRLGDSNEVVMTEAAILDIVDLLDAVYVVDTRKINQ